MKEILREQWIRLNKGSKVIIGLIAIGIIAITAIIISPIGTPIVSAVQNIFTGLGTVKDIKYGGKDVLKVIYQGKVVWERAPAGPPMATNGAALQTITSTTCPTTRIRAYDARDNHSYYVQKLADGKCWMLTNLAYIGGGTTTYGDTTTLTTISGYDTSYPNVKQVIINVPSSSPTSGYTTEPTAPNTITGANGQYGYLYNWCAAMGGQATACQNIAATQPNQGANIGSGTNNNINICPKGWRLPTGGVGGEFETLATTIGVTNDATGSTALRNAWLGVYGGGYYTGFDSQGGYGGYYSSTVYSATDAHILTVSPGGVSPAHNYTKPTGFAIRCIAD